MNHSYAREHAWNLWFVQTGPDRAAVDAALDRIRAATGLEVLDLPLLRPFNIDLGFSLKGAGRMAPPAAAPAGPVSEAEKRLLQALSEGLELTARPYAALGARFGLSEAGALVAVRAALERGLAGRFGLILNHRRLGFTANAMCVWALEEAEADAIGPALAAQPGVTLCYRRRADAARWPYTLYAMIHGRRRAETLAALDAATRGAGLAGRRREVLFSTRCYRQRGALIHRPDTERAHA